MRLTESVHVVGSGVLAFGLSYERDCRIYLVNGLTVDALLPGHLCVTLSAGQVHIQKALDCLDRKVLPPNIL